MSSPRRRTRPGATRRRGRGRLLRGPPGGRRGRALCRAGRDRGPDRPQRFGKDHPARRGVRTGAPGRGVGPTRRREPRRVPARGAQLARDRALVPGLPSLPAADRRRGPPAHPGCEPAGGSARLDAADAVGAPCRARQAGGGRRRRCAPSASSASAVTASPSSRPAPDGWSTWPRSSSPARGSCSSTSPPRGSRSARPRPSSRCCGGCTRWPTPPSSWSSTTCRWSSRSCDKVVMMESGSVVSAGTPDHVRRDPRALAAYLGASEEALAVSGSLPTRSGAPGTPDGNGERRPGTPGE